MKNTKSLFLASLIAGALLVPTLAVIANADNNAPRRIDQRHNDHARWEKHDQNHDFHLGRSDVHRGGQDHSRWNGPHDRRDFRREGRVDNRGHHNKPEIRQDFKDVRGARKEVQDSRKDLRKDYTELRKDRLELRRDLQTAPAKRRS